MSLRSEYRAWEINPTWSGSLGVLSVAGTYAEYELIGSGLIPRPQVQGWRAQPFTRGGRVPLQSVYPDYQPPAGTAVVHEETDPGHFDMSFAGGGSGIGFELGFDISSPRCGSRSTDLWGPHTTRTAQSFQGRGYVIDGSVHVGIGGGVQLLLYPSFGEQVLSPMGVIGQVIAAADLMEAMMNREIQTLQQLFPSACLILGSGWGLGAGLTLYEGVWSISELE